jgi:N-acetylglucosamine-6-phosphate deacetylase
MIVLSGADLILPDRILTAGTLVIDDGRIVEIRPGAGPVGSGVSRTAGSGNAPSSPFAFHGHSIVPGFIDVHVHGVEGFDTLGAGEPIEEIARRLPRYGVTGFCPTTVASGPAGLRHALDQVRRCRESAPPNAARVLPAHLESNFISSDYLGAQPAACIRSPLGALGVGLRAEGSGLSGQGRGQRTEGSFSASDIIAEIERAAPDVGIVTLAPELDGAIELIEWLVARGHRASLGHSGATYEQALAAIAAGARHATHLFNRMPPLHHRSPGLAGAILQSEEIAAEIICDGAHVHPALVRMAVAAKRPSRLFAITDGTAVSGLREGATARLGDQTIVAGRSTALLADGTLAGSALTMDRAFATLVRAVGLTLVDAAVMCATTPARELGLVGHGVIAPDAAADLTVLDADLRVVQTYVGGRLVYASTN